LFGSNHIVLEGFLIVGLYTVITALVKLSARGGSINMTMIGSLSEIVDSLMDVLFDSEASHM
jgi:hypothetical protein